MLCASDAIRPSDKVVIEGKISHSIISGEYSGKITWQWSPVKFQIQIEKSQQIEYHDGGKIFAMCHPFIIVPGDERALL